MVKYKEILYQCLSHFLLLIETIFLYFISQMLNLMNGISYDYAEIGFVIPVSILCFISPFIFRYLDIFTLRPIIFAIVKGFSCCYSDITYDMFVILCLIVLRFKYIFLLTNCISLFLLINDGYTNRIDAFLRLSLNFNYHRNLLIAYFFILFIYSQCLIIYRQIGLEIIIICNYSSMLCSILLIRLILNVTPIKTFNSLFENEPLIFYIVLLIGIPIGTELLINYNGFYERYFYDIE